MSAADEITEFLPEELGVMRIQGLEVYYAVEPEEPPDNREDGYSLGYPGAPEDIGISRVYFDAIEVSMVIDALEAATGLDIYERLKTLCTH